jgi:hypothetical protein
MRGASPKDLTIRQLLAFRLGRVGFLSYDPICYANCPRSVLLSVLVVPMTSPTVLVCTSYNILTETTKPDHTYSTVP